MINSETITLVLRFLWNLVLIGSIITISLKVAFRILHSLSPLIRYLLCVIAFALAIVLPVLPTFLLTEVKSLPVNTKTERADRTCLNRLEFLEGRSES